MARKQLGGWAASAVVASLVMGLAWAASAVAEDAPVAKTQRKESFHRLPPHFGKVINEQQRAQIYGIQDEYGPKIKALREQLAALVEECDAKVDAVLTPEQRQQIDQIKADAKAKRKTAAEERKRERATAKEEASAGAESATP